MRLSHQTNKQKAWTAAQKKIHLQNILVIGANSLVGILVIKELCAEACVRAAIEEKEIGPTTSEAAERASALGAQLFPIDFSSPNSVRKALMGTNLFVSKHQQFIYILQIGINRVFWVADQEDESDVWKTNALLTEIKEMFRNIDFVVKVSFNWS